MDSTRLVQRLVAVAALGGLHARRASASAFTCLDGGGCRTQPGARSTEATFGESRAAGVPVIDEDTGQAEWIGTARGGHAADAAAVAAGYQGQQADGRMLGGVQRSGNPQCVDA